MSALNWGSRDLFWVDAEVLNWKFPPHREQVLMGIVAGIETLLGNVSGPEDGRRAWIWKEEAGSRKGAHCACRAEAGGCPGVLKGASS